MDSRCEEKSRFVQGVEVFDNNETMLRDYLIFKPSCIAVLCRSKQRMVDANWFKGEERREAHGTNA